MEIYLDNAATTCVRPEVLTAMQSAEENLFYNSAAMYAGSMKSKAAIRDAGAIILSRLTKRRCGEVVFVSGATEGNNIVIFGKMHHARHHMVVLAGEHSSTYAPSVHLKQSGFDVDYVPLTKSGAADLNILKRVLRPNTTLVTFGMVNSDTGAIQPAREIVQIVRERSRNAHIHCDAVQAFCKFDFDCVELDFDSVVISAHKIYGPKGVGALWVRKGTNLRPIMYGGAQQDYRPGTENNAAIIGFGEAVRQFDTKESFNHISQLYNHLINNLPSGCTINGQEGNPYIMNIMMPNIYGHTVMNALSSRGIYVGLGSACSSKAAKNRTLIAMGIPENKTKNVLRVSFGIYNSVADVDEFLKALDNCLKLY